jgi:hypothetical protein
MKVGFLGLGRMGAGMAAKDVRSLRDAEGRLSRQAQRQFPNRLRYRNSRGGHAFVGNGGIDARQYVDILTSTLFGAGNGALC